MSGSALRVTWTATHTGTTVAGPATLVNTALANGGLSGTLTGTRLALTYSAPAGFVQGFHDCAISGSGTATAAGDSITGTLALTFTSCAGTGFEATGSDPIVLTR